MTGLLHSERSTTGEMPALSLWVKFVSVLRVQMSQTHVVHISKERAGVKTAEVVFTQATRRVVVEERDELFIYRNLTDIRHTVECLQS